MTIPHLTTLCSRVLEQEKRLAPAPWIISPGADVLPPRIGSTATDEWFVSVYEHKAGMAYRDGWIEPWIPKDNALKCAEWIRDTRTTAPRLAAALLELLPFVEHKQTCCLEHDEDAPGGYGGKCTCGLSAALARMEAAQ